MGGASGAVTTAQIAKEAVKAGKREIWRIRRQEQLDLEELDRKEAEAIGTQRAQIGASGITSEGSPTEAIVETGVRAARLGNAIKYAADQKSWEIKHGYELGLKAAKYSSISQSLSSGFASAGGGASGYSQFKQYQEGNKSAGGGGSVLGGDTGGWGTTEAFSVNAY
jgi:hypothetical protein